MTNADVVVDHQDPYPLETGAGFRTRAEVGHLRAVVTLASAVVRTLRHLDQTVDDALDAFAFAADGFDALLFDHGAFVRGGVAHEVPQQLDLVEDGLERIVDLVANGDGHFAERGEPILTADLAD